MLRAAAAPGLTGVAPVALEVPVTRHCSTSLVLACAACLFVASCSQDSGESCQTDGNCGDGLVCCKSDAAERGYCGEAADPECGRTGTGGMKDSGAAEDAAMSIDAASAEDSGAVDANMSLEDAGDDAG